MNNIFLSFVKTQLIMALVRRREKRRVFVRQNKGERRERQRGRVKSGRAGGKSRTGELCQYGGDGVESEVKTSGHLTIITHLTNTTTTTTRGGREGKMGRNTDINKKVVLEQLIS